MTLSGHIFNSLLQTNKLVWKLSPSQRLPPHTYRTSSPCIPAFPPSSVHSQMGKLRLRRGMWVSREVQCKPGSLDIFQTPSRQPLHVGKGLQATGLDLPEASVLSIGPHPSDPSSRVPVLQSGRLGFWPRLVTTLNLKRLSHPERSWPSILAEPWVLGTG